MACGCSDKKKLNDNKKLDDNNISNDNNMSNDNNILSDDKSLRLEDMKNMSIDEIVKLYRDGYRLDGSEEIYNTVNTASLHEPHQKITSMVANPSFSYIEATRGTSSIKFIALVNNGGSRGMVRVKAFNKTTGTCVEDSSMQTDTCIDSSYNSYIPSGLLSLVYAIKYSLVSFNTGCLRLYTCSSGDVCPSSCTTYSTSAYATNDNISVGTAAEVTPSAVTNLTLTPGNGTITATWTEPGNTSIFAYLIALTRVSDSVELARGYVRSNSLNMANLTNGTQYKLRVLPLSYDFYFGTGVEQTAIPVAPTPSNAQVFNTCWGSGLGATCSIPPEQPVVPTGTLLTIKSDIANSGTAGPIRAVFKANSVTISDQNTPSLATYPSGGFWSPTVSYTMPSTDVTLTVEGYGWNGTSWTLTSTQTTTISRSTPTCTGISIDVSTTTANVGDTITLTAYGITPTTQSYTVTFTDRSNTVLGTCTSSSGMCSMSWNTTGLTEGTYYVKAAIIGQCTSTELAIGLSMPIQQWNVDIYVRDSVTTNPIQGASVTVGVQTLQTDTNGHVLFRVDQGTINVTITKTGYNTTGPDPNSVYNNTTLNYNMVPVSQNPGSLRFITSPPGISGAEIHFVGDVPTLKGTTDVNGILTVASLTAGRVVNYQVIKTGYNTATGSVTVVGNVSTDVLVTLTVVTPTTGNVCMKSTPSGASITIGSIPQAGKTTALSSGGCVSTNIIQNLTPGTYDYTLSLTGYEDKLGSFIIVAGTTIDADAGTLTPLPTLGTLNISSTPDGARIYIMVGGVYQDTHYVTGTSADPTVITTLTAGAHSYKLTLTGYQDYADTFNITAGQTTTVSPTLVPAVLTTGSLSIASYPEGAEIYVETGDTFQDTLHITGPIGTPTIIPDLSVGTHRYKLTYPDYQDSIGTFTITANQITGPINVTMTKPGEGGGGMIFGLLGIAALGIMMSSKSSTTGVPKERKGKL